jgi:hypothetical protein
MDRDEQIREGFKKLAAKVGPSCTLLGTVQSVDEDEMTCVLYDEDSDLEFEDVRLRPVLDGKESITQFPKEGTWGLAIRLEDEDDWMLIAAGEIDKWRMKIGDSTIEVTDSGIVFNGGSLGGLIKIAELKNQLDKVTQILSAILSVMNGTTITEAGSGAPSSLQIALKTALTGKGTPDYSNIEDTKVTH